MSTTTTEEACFPSWGPFAGSGVKKPEVGGPPARCAWVPSDTCPIAYVSQSILAMDRLSIIRSFVWPVGADLQFAETGDELPSYLRT